MGKRPTRPGLSVAVLLIRWSTGHDVAEIELAQRAFRADLQIATNNAKDSTDLLETVAAWLAAGKAQILYIGSHGNPEGLKPSPNSKVTLTWSRLAQVLRAAKSLIWVCLGA